MSKDSEGNESSEDDIANPEDVANAEDNDSEENIPDDEKPEGKKIAALRARHKLEDYFESKKLKDALDYFEEEKNLNNKSETVPKAKKKKTLKEKD